MKIEELRTAVDAMIHDVGVAITQKKAGPEADTVLAELGLGAIKLLGEFLIDVKRIADAVERLDADLNK